MSGNNAYRRLQLQAENELKRQVEQQMEFDNRRRAYRGELPTAPRWLNANRRHNGAAWYLVDFNTLAELERHRMAQAAPRSPNGRFRTANALRNAANRFDPPLLLQPFYSPPPSRRGSSSSSWSSPARRRRATI